MNYNRPELLDPLAADYALGVLRQPARARFERLCASQSSARDARQSWEDRLLPLALSLAPVMPSDSCWQRIQHRLDAARPVGNARWPRGFRWWHGALAAGLLAVLVLVGQQTLWKEPVWQPVAVLAQAHTAPQWRVERSADASRISIHTLSSITLAASQSYELWALPTGSGHPVSLGLLPRSGSLVRALTATQRSLLQSAAKIAVSIEPAGGSPTGLPTGPVVIVASVSAPA